MYFNKLSILVDIMKAIVLGLLIAVYLFNGVCYLRLQSITFDEGSFLYYAARLVKGHPERIDPSVDNSKMPVVVLNLFPRAIQQVFHPDLKKTDNGDSDIFSGRYVTLIISVFTILLVYQWSKELYGYRAGLFSAFLLAFCPNMIASSGLVTTDSYSMLFLLATIYFTWKYIETNHFKYFILLSLFTGLSQLVKQSLFHLYILIPIIFIVEHFALKRSFNWKKATGYSITFLFISWLIINLGYYFRDTNTAIGDYHFTSHLFISIQTMLPPRLIIPFPKAFVTGLDFSKYYDQIGGGDYLGGSFGKVTILGKSANGGSFWYYYLVCFFFKTPIASLAFICTGLVFIFRRFSYDDFFRNSFFLLIPVCYYFIYMSFFYKTQIGIRQIIFIYPFLYILCGSLLTFSGGLWAKTMFVILNLFLICSVLRYWGNYFPYTNEFIPDKKMAYRFVGAANLEFGQANYFYQSYLISHPEVKIPTLVPEAGNFLINTNDYLDVWNRHRYDWLTHIKPYGHVAYSGLLVQVKPADLK